MPITKKVCSGMLVMVLLSTSMLAVADPGDGYDDGGPPPPPRHYHHDDYRGYDNGPGQIQDWHRGDRLPPEYRGPNYYVNDWQNRGLRPPPRGHRWVEVNGGYVLAAVATGVIASILLGPGR